MSARFPTLPDESPHDFQPEAFDHDGIASYHGTERLCNRCRIRAYENKATGLCRYCTKDTGREMPC